MRKYLIKYNEKYKITNTVINNNNNNAVLSFLFDYFESLIYMVCCFFLKNIFNIVLSFYDLNCFHFDCICTHIFI